MTTKRMRGSALAFLLVLGFSMPAVTAEAVETPRILITFDNVAARKASGPGHSYRFRSRYAISREARIDAKAVADEYKLVAVDDWPIESIKVYCVVYEAAGADSVAALIARLNKDARVESVQRLHRFQSMASPVTTYNDSYAGLQYGLRSMNILAAHKFARGTGVKVAIVDTHIDLDHEDLSYDGIQVLDFVSDRRGLSGAEHGTAVASVIGANSNNRKGIVGVAPSAELIALGACWSESTVDVAHCDSFTLAKAMDYLIRSPPDLVNLSIAGPYDALLARLIARAVKNGTIIVAAMPNSSQRENIYPAGFPGVIAIGSAPPIDSDELRSLPAFDGIFAPGDQIMVALPDDVYDFRSGSSLASANASGVIALLLEHSPGLGGKRIADILRKSQVKNGSGSTMINACVALAEIDGEATCQ